MNRQQAIAFTLFAASAGLLCAQIGGFRLGAAATLAILCLTFAYQYPRQALWAFLAYLPFAGTVTYWLGGGHVIFQFVKDLLYFPALISVIQYYRKPKTPLKIPKPPILSFGALLACVLLTFLSVNAWDQLTLQSNGSPLMVGIVGVKVFVGYVPLMVCASYLIRSKQEFLFLTRLFVILAIICCGLSLIQYGFLVAGLCQNTEDLSRQGIFHYTLDARCFVGGSLYYSPSRKQLDLPGTFVSPLHWAFFLISNSFLTFAAFCVDSSKRWRTVSCISIILVVMATILSGQGTALVLVPASYLILFFITFGTRQRSVWIGAGLAAVLIAIAAIASRFIQERVQSFIGRWQYSPPHQFIYSQLTSAFRENLGLLGIGLGRATNSAGMFGETVFIETYPAKLLYEIGPFGLMAFLGFVTILNGMAWKAWRSLRDARLRSSGICLWSFLVFISYNPYWYPLDTDPVNVYYWFLAGVVLKLPELDREGE